MPRHRKVCCTDKSTQYSVVPLGVLVTITFRRRVNARTACSALLLFHGTLSQSRNVNSLSRFLLIRFCKEELASVVHCMAATSFRNRSADRLCFPRCRFFKPYSSMV